ncbi:MAG: hypothetical protein AB7K04_15465 [Pseudorhodoplanes sp.]
MPFSPAFPPVVAPPLPADPGALRREASARFTQARLEVFQAMTEAGKLPALSPLERAQAAAVAGLAGLRLHRIVGTADRADLLALRDDLEAVAQRVDPLVAAFGREAAANAQGIDQALFADPLLDALDGNALFVLAQAADALAEGRDDTLADAARAFRDAAE